jgi:hypothetical protein
MQLKSTRKFPPILALVLLLAACGPSAPAATATPEPTPTPEVIHFDYTVHSSRTEPALERLRGLTWEGGYIWAPFVVYYEDTYHLFYNGFGTQSRGVGLATSSDGIHFTRAGEDPVLLWEGERELFSPLVYQQDDGSWVMYMVSDEPRTGLAGDRVVRFSAPALEGPWEGGEVVYQAPSEDHWTHEIVIRSLLVEPDRILIGFDARHDKQISIGLMQSTDGLNFELVSEEPVFNPGGEGKWDPDGVSSPMLFATADGYEMFYLGLKRGTSGRFSSYEGFNLWVGYASSPDGLTWQRDPNNPVMQIPDELGTPYMSATKVDDTYYIYFVYGQGAYGIGAATMTISSP